MTQPISLQQTACDAVLERAQQERHAWLTERQETLKTRAEASLAKMGLDPVPAVAVHVSWTYGDSIFYVATATFCGVDLILDERKDANWSTCGTHNATIYDLGDLAPALERAKASRDRMEKRHAFFRRLLGRSPA